MSLPFITLVILLPVLSACGSAAASTDLEAAQGEPTRDDALAAAETGTIRVTVEGFRNHKGQLLTSLFAGSKGFPGDSGVAARRKTQKIDRDKIEVVFDKVAVGSYAVAVLHDEDMNFKLKTGMFGIPKEGYGVSNNAKGRFGPPSYSDAEFKVTGQRDVELTISMIYH